MWFVLFGEKSVLRDVKGAAPERAQCARCGFVSDLRLRTRRTWFTLYFLPVFPISRAEHVLVCNRCGASYYPGSTGFRDPQPVDEDADAGKTVLVCPACSGKMRIPLKLEKAIRVTCPHCRDQFTVSVTR